MSARPSETLGRNYFYRLLFKKELFMNISSIDLLVDYKNEINFHLHATKRDLFIVFVLCTFVLLCEYDSLHKLMQSLSVLGIKSLFIYNLFIVFADILEITIIRPNHLEQGWI